MSKDLTQKQIILLQEKSLRKMARAMSAGKIAKRIGVVRATIYNRFNLYKIYTDKQRENLTKL